ncbi:formylmethionine deformylase [Sulfurimonas gotlandica GD1]|jgi:peptide deformylase|uniref:Formylmethionine deformylase n=1 Tax=Sulfurimonas gotlandica (strain DSM 19862 / JCM 16533 / GD1) TaxID=929558 RepID=B6BH03_SULGG|nr:peptide deformylase [Sulfurimonas gotlandica]EDZ62956.1 formylmethionine deformylase [Sulfurimonas gotlandica GD1]EHP29787.1 formylmethionine deformylase [Sulfurimonas gotlandica GD1]
MVKEITKYPTKPSLEFGANVRFFNDELFALIQDLKDTIEVNSLDALAAFQIGSPLSVIVVKKGGEFLELINPRVLKREGSVEPVETTAYFPGMSAKTKRYEKITLMYEDRDATQKFLEADGELAITLQRKVDYTFGSHFRFRLDKDEQKLFDSKLEFGTDAITKNDCPTVFKRDRILQVFKFLFVFGLLGVMAGFFVSEDNLSILVSTENYIMASMLGLVVAYFFYAQYEGRQYKHCTSCQIGNIIGTCIISLLKLLALFLASYFLL